MKPKCNPFHRTSLPLALLALAVSQSVQAVDTSTTAWSGTTDTVWGNSTNWAGSVLPSSTVSALFNSTFANPPTLGAAQTTEGIWLASSVGQDVTIDSGAAQTLTITGDAVLNSQTAAGIYMNDSANHNLTIGPNTSILLSNSTGFYNQESSASTLTISGGLNLNTKTLTVGAGAASTGAVTITGNITSSSNGAITINTAGTVTLSGNNSYKSTTTLTSGTLIAGSSTAFGTGALSLGGGTLQASTDVILAPSSVALGNGTTTFSGANSITIGGNSTALIGGGDKTITNNLASGKTLTFTGDLGLLVNSTNRLLTIAGTGNTTFSGILSNGTSGGTGGRITVTSTGTTTLSGNNTYTGLTTMNAAAGTLILSGNNSGTGGVTLTTGKLIINNNNALGAVGSTLTITAGTIDSTVSGISNAIANPVFINGNFTFGGTNDLNLGSGAVTGSFASRTITLSGTGKTLTLGGTWGNTNDANNTLTVNGAGNTLILGGIALDNAGTTARTQTIAGSGNVTVTGAVVNGSGATGQSLTIASTGTITLQGNNTYSGAFSQTGAGTVSLTGAMNGPASVTVNNASANFNQSSTGVIQGASTTFTLTSGSALLAGNNTYGGTTTLTAGSLKIGVASVGSVGSITSSAVGTGALSLNGGTISSDSTTERTIYNPVTIGGNVTLGDATNTGKLSLAANVDLGSTARTLTTASDVQIDGALAGTGGLTKTGAGSLTLAGNNSAYSGITTVNAGNLVPTLATALPNYNSSGKVVFNGGVIVTKVGDGTTTGWSTGQIDSLLTNATKTSGKLGIDTSNGDVTQWTAFTGSAGNFGALGLTKLGANTLILTQNNTYTGATVISSGTLQLGDGTAGNDGSIGSTSSVTNNGTLFYNLNTTSSVGYAISGTGGLIKAGSGELQLNTAYKGITYTGPTWIQAGVLRVWQSYSTPLSRYTIDAAGALKLDQGGGRGITIGSLVGSGTVTLKGDLTLGGDNTTDANFTGRISQNGGTSRLLKNGSGTQTLSGSNSYYGTVVSEGTLRVGNANALGGGTLAVNGGALDLNGYSVGVTALSGSIGGLITSSTTGAITLTTSGTVDSVFAGVIEDGSATSVALSKTGAGTLTLSGTNTYTGGTNVSAGTLAINGDQSLSTGAVNVSALATLGGNGIVGGATTFTGASIHAPGSAATTVGTQTFSSTVTYGSGTIFEWDLNTVDGGNVTDPGFVADGNTGTYDRVTASGAITATGSGDAVFKIVLDTGDSFADAFWSSNKSWTNIFTGGTGSATNLAALFSGFQASGVIDSSGIVTGRGQFTLSSSSNTLTWTAVPEPTSAVVGLLIGAGLLRRRRGC